MRPGKKSLKESTCFTRSPPRSAYIHIPFCRHRCGYCNFTVVAGRDDLAERYLDALAREISSLGTPRQVDTIYIGGGTPTRLAVGDLQRLLSVVLEWFPPASGYEFTVESNPLDLDKHKSALLAEYGVTRISLGVQSFQEDKLKLLERDHRERDILRAYELAQLYFDTVSLDLIFATPGETISTWCADLRFATRLSPQHVSTYGLTFEKGTLFWNRRNRGELQGVPEELERSMYELAIDHLKTSDYEHYEVSSFARTNQYCKHNNQYWNGSGYYAAGAGACRFVDGRRETNHRSVTTYIKRVLRGDSSVAHHETLSLEESARERLVLGLRTLSGIDRRQFAVETGCDLESLAGNVIDRYVQLGMLHDDGLRIRLTRKGLMLSDAIWPDLI